MTHSHHDFDCLNESGEIEQNDFHVKSVKIVFQIYCYFDELHHFHLNNRNHDDCVS